jgi:hypothetical protein
VGAKEANNGGQGLHDEQVLTLALLQNITFALAMTPRQRIASGHNRVSPDAQHPPSHHCEFSQHCTRHCTMPERLNARIVARIPAQMKRRP